MQKATIAAATPRPTDPTWITPAAAGAASSSRFLLHWRGRHARSTIRAMFGCAAPAGACAGSGSRGTHVCCSGLTIWIELIAITVRAARFADPARRTQDSTSTQEFRSRVGRTQLEFSYAKTDGWVGLKQR
jgi:hypothetical protein